MKKYKKLLSFGCSFTQGGGLNSGKFHKWLEFGNSLPIDTGFDDFQGLLPEHLAYSAYHSFPGYLSRKLDCELENLSLSGASNDYIFKKAYDEISKLDNPQEVLVTMQSTFFNRLYLRIPGNETQVNFNNLDTAKSYFPYSSPYNDIGYNFYKTYLQHFYDEDHEYEKLRMKVDTISAYCEKVGVDLVFLFYMDAGKNPIQHPHRVDLLKYKNLGEMNADGVWNITNFTEGRFKDCHFSPVGNAAIANLIYKHVEEHF